MMIINKLGSLRNILLLSFVILTFISCEVAKHSPIVTFKDQTEKLHGIIEKSAQEEFVSQNYQSLSFGDLKVYKPEAFVQLDSVYRIKNEYIKNNDLRGLNKSGIEDLIPGYRVAAQEKIDEVQYEIEHLFQTSTDDSIKVYHSFYLFDYKDSLISTTPFYDFNIAKEYATLYYAYQFDYHFVTDRDIHASRAELDFIQFFKQREVQLIGEEALEAFMNHTVKVMDAARKMQTIDYRQVSKRLALDDFKKLNSDVVIEKFGVLYAIETDGFVDSYELEIEWTDKLDQHKTSTFSFSPYLEILDVKTEFD